MEHFRLIVGVLSMILGLAVARLLLGLVGAFRAREQSPLHWIPLVWTGCLFIMQLQFWWAINQVPDLSRDYGFLDFLALVLLTLALFLAAALMLPSRSEDETGGLLLYFHKDGRYALLAISGFLVLALIVNVIYLAGSPMTLWGLLDVPLIALPIIAFASRSYRLRAGICLAYVPLLVVDLWVSLGT